MNFKKVFNFFESKFEEIFACFALVIISLCVIFQVISRYVFNFGITWTEELAGFAMPWAIYMGAALGVRERFHIRILVGVRSLPMMIQYLIIFIGDFLWLAFNIFMIKYGIDYLKLMWEFPVISQTLSISNFWPETIIVIAYSLMMLRLVQIYVKWFRDGRKGLPGC
jgi:TRAP-type C4-dicarboxylate transport system permease small subunit